MEEITEVVRIAIAMGSDDCCGGNMRFGPFLVIALILFILWVGGFVFFHVAGALIHLLLIIAVISLIVHFFTGSKTAV
jgi:Family of unknown function (DUF5670)